MGSGNNMDAATTPGAYFVNQNTGAGFPTGAYGYGHLIVAKSNQNPTSIVQIYITSGRRGIYMRELYWGGSWNDWERIYDQSILNDSNILSPLASALGGIERTINDADNADIGISYIPTPALHTPDSNHVLVRTSFIGQNRKIQYAYATFKANNPQGIFYRISNNDGTFTGVEWIRMYDPTILTDSAILAPLALALGGAFMSLVGVQKIRADINYLFSPKGIVPNTSSEDDLIETGIYSIMSDNTAATFPNSMLIVFTQSCTDWPTQNNFTLQFSCSAGGSINGRVCWWGTWYAWSRIDLFGCKSLAELKAALANV